MHGKSSKSGGRTPSATWLRSQIAMHLGREQYNALCIQADQAISRGSRTVWFLEHEAVRAIPGLVEEYQRYRNEEIASTLENRRLELANWRLELAIETSLVRRQNIQRAIERCEKYIAQHSSSLPSDEEE